MFPANAEESLLLRKGTGRTAHGGGTRIPFGGEDYRVLRDWIAAGTPVGSPDAPRVVALRVEPVERVMGQKADQQLKVFAKYSDGVEKDVTRHARFQSNTEAVAAVSAGGLVTTRDVPGEAAVMAAYLGEVGQFRLMVPRPGELVKNTLPQFNLIDKLVDAKLAKLNVAPSGLCDDADYLRRVYLDLTGTLPTPEEARKFLADACEGQAREAGGLALLDRPEFADLWALRWADLLRVDRQPLGHQRAHLYYKWIRDSIAMNKPFDQFAANSSPPKARRRKSGL